MTIHKHLASAVVILCMASPGWSLEYPCPSDPGFCYRDVGDDGCFDSGTDEGPINDEIEGSSTLAGNPPPGSIVCPPSVEDITASDLDIRLSVPTGSSVLFYGARITVDDLEILSGDEILLGGRVFKPSSLTTSTVTLSAENDVYFESGAKLNPGAGNIEVQSTSGDVTIGPNALLKASSVFILAPAGDIFVLDDVVTIAHGVASRVHFIASGVVDLTRPKITCSEVILFGASVSIHQKASIKGKRKSVFHVFQILADPGNVTIDRISLKTDTELLISGTNVTIGVPNNGSVSSSTLTAKNPQDPETVTITATEAIRLERVRLKSDGDVTIETSGTSVDVLDSRLFGIKTNPVFEISATGAGSTCDLTGTPVLKASLVTNCDTVIGP